MSNLSQNQIQKHFKNIAKLIYLSAKGPSDATAYRTALSGVSDQLATGSASDAAAIVSVGVPATNGINAIAKSLDGLQASVKTWTQTYLTQVVAVDLGLAAGAAVSAIGAALISSMNTPSSGSAQTVAPSGSNNLKTYFGSQFGIGLPQNVSPTIQDAWITADPV